MEEFDSVLQSTTTTAVATKVTVARPTNLPPLRPFRQLSILSLDSNYFTNSATTLKLIEDIENENENDCENEDGNDDSELDDAVEEDDEMLFSSTTCTCTSTSTANNNNTNNIIKHIIYYRSLPVIYLVIFLLLLQ
mmetsp:Transcript_28760/g.30919  ORF Transcript_28760/g.30919 Transcript_28760/m.30919 type:complete len:136 (-) Transcript_28760:1167-1574(-)